MISFASLTTMERSLSGRQAGGVLPIIMVMMAILMAFASGIIDYFESREVLEVERSLAELRAYWAAIGELNYVRSRALADGLCPLLPGDPDPYKGCSKKDWDATSTNSAILNRAELSINSRAGALQKYIDMNSGVITELGTVGGTGCSASGCQQPGVRLWSYPIPKEVRDYAQSSSEVSAWNGNLAKYDFGYQFYVWARIRARDTDIWAAVAPSASKGAMLADFQVSKHRSGEAASNHPEALLDIHSRFRRLVIGFYVNDNNDSTAVFIFPASPPTWIGVSGESKIQFILKAERCYVSSVDPADDGTYGTNNANCPADATKP